MNDKIITEDNLFDYIDRNLVEYWSSIGRVPHDFFCSKCGKLMLDIDDIQGMTYLNGITLYGNKSAAHPYIGPLSPEARDQYAKRHNKEKSYAGKYVENDQNRWLVIGKFLSDKNRPYFRKMCWTCFENSLEDFIREDRDININSKKAHSKWKRYLKQGILKKHVIIPPSSCRSPTWYFKLLFDISDEQLKAEISRFDTASLDSFVRRFGNKSGLEKYKQYCIVQAKAGCTKEHFIEKYGSTEGLKKYYSVCKNKGVSKENCIRKYGDDKGLKFWNEYCDLQADAGNTEKYFIEKYGEYEGKKKYREVCSQKINSLENFIRKYGEEQGKIKYENYFKNIRIAFSGISQELFRAIDDTLGDFANSSKWALKNGECSLVVKNEKHVHSVRPDYMLNNKIIEFNSDYWHMNPSKYGPDDIRKNFDGTKTVAKDLWENEKIRLDSIRKLGYEVKVVWESDYHNDKQKVIDECVKFLKK